MFIKKIPYFLAFLAFFISFSFISKGPYHADCLSMAIAIENSIKDHKIHFLHSHGYPLMSFLGIAGYSFLKILAIDDPILAVNLINVILSGLTIIPFYLFVDKLINRHNAIISSLLLCFCPLYLSTSVYGNSHIPFLFFIFLSLYCLLRFLESWKWAYCFFSSLFFGLSGATRIQDMAMMTIPFTFLYFVVIRHISQEHRLNKNSLRNIFNLKLINPDEFSLKKAFGVYFFSISIVIIVVGFFYFLVFQSRGEGYYSSEFFAFRVLDRFSGLFTSLLIKSLGYLYANFSFLGILLIILGIYKLSCSHRRLLVFFISWFLVPFLFLGNNYFTTPRFFLTCFIPLILVQGYFLSLLMNNKKKRFSHSGKILLLIVIAVSFFKIYPILSFRHQYDISPEYGRWISYITEPNSKIIVGDEGMFIRYYGKRKTIHQIITDTTYYQQKDDFVEELKSYKNNLDQMLNQGIPLYITESALFTNNSGFFNQFITTYYDLELMGQAPFEPWHRRCLSQIIMPIKLFKLKFKGKN